MEIDTDPNNMTSIIQVTIKASLLNRTSKQDLECKNYGTALRLRIDTSRISTYSEVLAKCRNDGYEAAKRFTGNVEPLIAPTMLAKDFQET